MAQGIGSDFKRFFIRGLAAFLPTVVTLWLIVKVFGFVQENIGRHINAGVQWLIYNVVLLAWGKNLTGMAEFWDKHLKWIGFLLAIVGIYFFGKFVASFVGRATWRMMESAFFRLPVVKQIYPFVKQVTDFLLSEKKVKFNRVVAVEYPRKGIWSIGLVTGPGMKTLKGELDEDLLTVFVPSSPMPATGYTITVRHDEVIDLPVSIDDALRFTVSAGVIMPPNQQLSTEEIDQARYRALPESSDKEKSV